MSNADIFIERYKCLEEVVRSTYHLSDDDSISYYLRNDDKYKRYKEEIKYCQEVRNLLSHKKKVDEHFAVEPNHQMIDFVNRLIERIQNRAKCSDIQVGIKDVFWQPFDGSVKNAMKIMREKLFTHIPILENGVVKGVFDENSVFNYLSDEEIVAVEDDLTFRNIVGYISLDNREMEEFLFFKSSLYIEELENKFEEAFNRGKRIGVTFLTQSGSRTEKLLGIVTPWDIIAASE